MISTIVGPPAIHTLNPPSATLTDVESLAIQAGDCKLTEEPPRGRTENNSATFLSTGNPCLDFFFHVVPDTPSHELIERLELAWAHDSLTALKLICNLRGVRGTEI